MAENNILTSIADLNTKLYELLTGITVDVPGVRVMGFDSSRTRDPLPTKGLQIRLSAIEIDRNRPTPQILHPVQIPSDPQDFIIDGELVEDIPTQYTNKYPLPLLLTYEIDTWCHDAQTQLSIDHGLLKLFPERGVLRVEINSVEFELPFVTLGVQNLDDLEENFRERIYRYQIEAWVVGNMSDSVSKIITKSITEVWQQESDIKLMEVIVEAE